MLQLYLLQAFTMTTLWIAEASTPPWKTELDSVRVCNSYKLSLIHYLLGDLSLSLHTLTDKPSTLQGIQSLGGLWTRHHLVLLAEVPPH